MSVEQPEALALLDIARETLLDKVVPLLEGDARYQALMIANAMVMAMRDLGPERVDREDEAKCLLELYADLQESGAEIGGQGDGLVNTMTPQLEDRFARDLRSGRFAGDVQLRVRQLLRARIEARLAVSNPRRLGSRTRVDPD